MFRLDPMIKLAIIVAIGITITMLLGVGQPSERDKLAVINKSQINLGHGHAPQALKTGNVFSLENYRVNLD
jgi:hypothetical protein